ncbi:Multicopper oxidase with three cupredoxin domains (includes cell division protein FtsP and spore coat protein CotA) [Sinosporangium album]|uniref:Multicopper oxidase with three cupredoxin domains (Includes cell division protein FtsP and spore coat protein CotA) n=1 Tax=Sinosporangium album TaxID=504805 RepID=A0A1G7ZQF7_9ACTN|nr:multicopper oxidase domain-containing protein [Sinosporangium album]SDH10777.1 Multicopper oxidase with three cupredoxin domains (includes cell division protein FtsP and spore coat protein CotA) [Sinosporangium album]
MSHNSHDPHEAPRDRSPLSRRALLAGAVTVGAAGGYLTHASIAAAAARPLGGHATGHATGHAARPAAGAPGGPAGGALPVEFVAHDAEAAAQMMRASTAAAGVLQLRPYRDRLRVPPRARVTRSRDVSRVTITMRPALIRLHADMPPTPLWTYDGHFPGPTIEVRRGERLRVTWRNSLSGAYPVTAVQLRNSPGPVAAWDLPGRGGATPKPEVAALPPWTVVHLHGAQTTGSNDGWAENAVGPGHVQLVEYVNDQRSAALWYHDHAMHISRFNTMTGLTAGMYLIRDDEEEALDLPGGEFEIPLVLCDRNFDTGPDGKVDGRLLHKVIEYPQQAESVIRSFTGPYTLVNGTVWPYAEVRPRWYRFRLLNASSIRPYLLRLVDEQGESVAGRVFQIGSDAGLLPAPVPIQDWVLLVPAERADVLVDFTGLEGRSLRWVDSSSVASPVPDVIDFRVRGRAPGRTFAPPATVSRSYARVEPDKLPEPTERMVLITPAFPINAEMWEMVKVEAPSGALPLDGIVQFQQPDGTVTTYQRIARDYQDPVGFHIAEDSWERWQFVSLEGSGVPHPMHVHGFTFQATARMRLDGSGFRYFTTASGRLGGGTATPIKITGAMPVRPEEHGWKDVIALGFRQLVTVVGRFTGTTGRLMHHCHVYEHEDHKMMRPIVVLPGPIMALDPHRGGH